MKVECKGAYVGEGRLDLLVGGRSIVELEAVRQVLPLHEATVVSSRKATDKNLALLIHFNAPRPEDGVQRVVLS
ncbi:MAG: GxxExxY protein [Planctomycetota bacterium]|nr:MAG: GxxExxY protein [Planctomycetota bacterium]